MWFRWELPPLQAYYLTSYWESSKRAQEPGSTIQIQWLYKTAPGRRSEPLADQDVDSNGSGLVPVALAYSARQRGWTQLVKMPVQNWNSSELESFLQRYLYGNRSFRELVSDPLLFLSVIPIIFLYGVILMRREIVEEWRQLYRGPFGDDLILDAPALWNRCKEQMSDWKERLIAGATASLSDRRSEPKGHPCAATDMRPNPTGIGTPSRIEKQVLPEVPPVNSKRHVIFPGAEAIRNGDVLPKRWDESQWID